MKGDAGPAGEAGEPVGEADYCGHANVPEKERIRKRYRMGD